MPLASGISPSIPFRRKGDNIFSVLLHNSGLKNFRPYCHQNARSESDGRMQKASKNDLAVESQSGGRIWTHGVISAATKHWPEYLIEAACLGLFMVSACSFTVLLQHPASKIRQMLPSAFVRRLVTGVAMGATAIALIYSPWGKQSGAHLNPSVTLTFFRLGKIEPWDACFYVVPQFIGGTLGVLLSGLIWGHAITEQNVRYAATLPGAHGTGVAFVAEMVISFVMMTMILNVSNSAQIARFTGVIAGALVATYVTLEAPLSGMSMSPARSFASAAPREDLEFTLDLLHRTTARHDACRASLSLAVGQARCILCQAAPRQRQAMYFPLQLSGSVNTESLSRRQRMKHRKLIYGLVLILAIALWAAFRPERLFLNAKVNEAMPAGLSSVSQTVLSSGPFHSVAHESTGTASIYQLADGKRILRLTNFATSNGPDVHVYLIAANDASDSDTVKHAGFVEVGALKGNIGDQNYEISSDVDLNKYRAVTIWCKRFDVNFATAPLTAAGTATSATNR